MKGNITVTESALAAILGLAAHEVPGVLGMSPAGIRESISRILGRSEASEGVVVKPDPGAAGKYQADLYVVLAFGARIPTVVDSIGERVQWAAKSLAGVELSTVRIHVVGVSRG
ncbi:MAG: Asp23/Gls24 family envelope stress response protein [Meiothermus sp.]|uniref:Asp23/Gls24 family envelope stress response protein n=1 Tax=Meiothermus sp. TaxID=1955249 RepID=UPI0025F59025|nr:Asp23/Gls24 family envelope stress response protein [Meiothermus sp.]MCS7069078.1 Asp23/Gls24 family envelope stress response protein [Meiothermus sp.]MCX7601645.1 Asp23/Gls24 family envelope stress response protein [Meiothermus sp.]MDW8425929.1 Asp23/Gls24 family envelope stress response protein [Meiothermus sp.]